jgi:hypothetical protein
MPYGREVTVQEVVARLERIEQLLGLQRMKQASERGGELRANSNISDHCGSDLSNHCGGAAEELR